MEIYIKFKIKNKASTIKRQKNFEIRPDCSKKFFSKLYYLSNFRKFPLPPFNTLMLRNLCCVVRAVGAILTRQELYYYLQSLWMQLSILNTCHSRMISFRHLNIELQMIEHFDWQKIMSFLEN